MLGQHLPVIELSFQVRLGWPAARLACNLELTGCCHCGERTEVRGKVLLCLHACCSWVATIEEDASFISW